MAKNVVLLVALSLLASAAAAAVVHDAENRVDHHKGADRPHGQVAGHTPVADTRPGKRRSGQGRHRENEAPAVSRHRVGEGEQQAAERAGHEPRLPVPRDSLFQLLHNNRPSLKVFLAFCQRVGCLKRSDTTGVKASLNHRPSEATRHGQSEATRHGQSEATRHGQRSPVKDAASHRRLSANGGAHAAGSRLASDRQVGVFRQQSRHQGEGRRANRRGPNGKGQGHFGSAKPGRHVVGQSHHEPGNALHSSAA